MMMKNYKSYLGVLAVMIMNSCTTLPQTSQTGQVRDINIESTASLERVQARPGDEVRWINHRKGSVTLILQDTKQDRLACNRGFSDEGIAVVGANQTASICFNKAGEVKYNVRMESMLPGGEELAQGQIEVQ
jgi:plastocyanin